MLRKLFEGFAYLVRRTILNTYLYDITVAVLVDFYLNGAVLQVSLVSGCFVLLHYVHKRPF